MTPKAVFALVLVALLLVVAIQNTAVVEVRLLIWTLGMSRALLILISAVLGFATGIAIMGLRIRSR